MKMNKSFKVGSGVLLTTSLLLAGCGGESSGDSENEEVALNMALPNSGSTSEQIDEIIAQYEEDNPNIDISVDYIAYDSLKQKILTSAKSGDYDITMVDQPWTAQFANANILQKPPEELSSEKQDDIFEPFLEGASFDGELYAMPWKNDAKFLYYNKSMLEEAGYDSPPSTWSELEEQSQAMKDEGIVETPLVWSWSQSEALVVDYTLMSGAFGGELVKDQKASFNTENNIEALSFMNESIESDITNSNSTEFQEQDVQDTFINENAAFALNWSFMYEEVKNSDIADDLGVALVPGSEEVNSATVNGGEGLGITSGSEHPEEAWDFIQYMTSKDVQKNHVGITLPIWKSLYEDEKVREQNPELVDLYSEQFEYLVSRPQLAAYGDLSQNMQVELQKTLAGDQEPKTTLQKLQKQSEELLSE